MNNIFEGAYFGKPYKTRNGKIVRYCGKQVRLYLCELDGAVINYFQDGSIFERVESEFDIVSELTEEVDEEELDELLMQLLICAQQGYTQCAPDDVVIRNMKKILKEEEEDRQWILQNLCLATL